MEDGRALVAIVDDEEPIRTALLRVFAMTSCQAEAYASASDFLDALPHSRPDCVLLDMHMPGMKGVEVLRLLSALDDPPPVIVLTGDDDHRLREECMQLGSKLFLLKPLGRAQLLESVNQVVGLTAGPERQAAAGE